MRRLLIASLLACLTFTAEARHDRDYRRMSDEQRRREVDHIRDEIDDARADLERDRERIESSR